MYTPVVPLFATPKLCEKVLRKGGSVYIVCLLISNAKTNSKTIGQPFETLSLVKYRWYQVFTLCVLPCSTTTVVCFPFLALSSCSD